MLEDIAKQIKTIATCETRTLSLREQMELDYSLIRLDPFLMPVTEGKWESYSSNSPGTLNDSYVRTLASAPLKLWIKPLSSEEGKRKSKARSMTEQLVGGAIWTSNRMRTTVPEEKDLQASLASDACERGGTAIRCFLREKKDNGGMKLIPDIVVWDALNIRWIPGTDGLLWVCHIRYGSKAQLQNEYKGALTGDEDEQGRMLIYDVWDEDEWGIFCKNGGGEWIAKEKHKLGHIPVSIISVGARPFRQSSEYEDTLKDSWCSSIAKNRHLYKIQNRLMSYILTQAGLKVKPTIKEFFDSTEGGHPLEVVGDPNSQGGSVSLDRGQGQDLEMFTPTVSIEEVFHLLAEVNRQISMGGIAPIALGFTEEAQTASGTALLTEAAKQSLAAFKQNMESQFKWLADEIVWQYKTGEFGETDLEGYEWNGNKFEVHVSPANINGNEHFDAEINLNLKRDELSEMALVKEGMRLGIFSRRGGMERFNDDPDLVQAQIEEEQVSDMLGLPIWNTFENLSTEEENGHKVFSAKKAEENKLFLLILLNKINAMSAPPGGGSSQPTLSGAKPTLQLPQAEPIAPQVGAIGAEPVTEASRLAKLGLLRGR